MATKLLINCSTGQVTTPNLTAAEVAQQAADAPVFAAISAAAAAARTNGDTLVQRAQTALTTNTTFLALASPTNAQTLAQVQALTKECSALIRLLTNALDSTAGA